MHVLSDGAWGRFKAALDAARWGTGQPFSDKRRTVEGKLRLFVAMDRTIKDATNSPAKHAWRSGNLPSQTRTIKCRDQTHL